MLRPGEWRIQRGELHAPDFVGPLVIIWASSEGADPAILDLGTSTAYYEFSPEHESWLPIAWSSDGCSLIFRSLRAGSDNVTPRDFHSFMRWDVLGGQIQFLFEEEVGHTVFNEAGDKIVYSHGKKLDRNSYYSLYERMTLFDVTNNESLEFLTKADGIKPLYLSEDLEQLIYLGVVGDETKLFSTDVSNQTVQEIANLTDLLAPPLNTAFDLRIDVPDIEYYEDYGLFARVVLYHENLDWGYQMTHRMGVLNLTDSIYVELFDGIESETTYVERELTWSPERPQFVTTSSYGRNVLGIKDLVIIDAINGDIQPQGLDKLSEQHPWLGAFSEGTWGTDGKSIIFDSNYQVGLYELDSGAITLLDGLRTTHPYSQKFIWSPVQDYSNIECTK